MKHKKSVKKANISLRRKVSVAYYRAVLAGKLLLVLFFYILFFTHYLDFIKVEVMQNAYELAGEFGFKLENVTIEGQENTTEAEILTALNADTGTPIFAIDLGEVKKQLEQNPWVKQIAVKRRLPSTLQIAIREKTPIAIWQINQQLFLIDEDGAKITSNNIEKFPKLMQVVGIDANLYASKLISDLAAYPGISNKIVSAVRYGQRRWNLNFRQNITIKLPEEKYNQALDYINELDKAGKLLDQGYKVLDLRDASKYYIEK